MVCKVCGKTGDCITLRQFKQHVKSHELKCSYCGDTGDKFTTLRQYKDHLRSHVKCPYCERRTDFSTGSNYQKHLNSHNQNVKCDECETSFKQKAYLNWFLTWDVLFAIRNTFLQLFKYIHATHESLLILSLKYFL